MSASPWRGRYLPITIGVFALTFLFAFEAIAVATVMPEIAEALDGLSLYAVSFAAPTAAGIIAMTIAGPWCDRAGPRPVLNTGLVVFIVGVLIAGLAPEMVTFLIGRAVHGIGAGLLGVALYVVVAQAFPEELRARVFSVLSAAWLLPAIVGPIMVAHIAEWTSWRWVFLGVPALAIGSWLLIVRSPSAPAAEPSTVKPPVAAGCLAAAGVFLISIAGQREIWGWQALIVLGIGVVIAAAAKLLPVGTWIGGRGLPSLITVRAMVWAAFIGVEAYLPLTLVLARGFTLAEAGTVLSISGIFWFVGAWAAGRWRFLADDRHRTIKIGLALATAGIAAVTTAGASAVPLAFPIIGWTIATVGVGLIIPTVAVLSLATVEADEAGKASSAIQLNDAIAQSMMLSVGSVFFATISVTSPVRGGTVLMITAAVIAALAFLPAQRTRLIRR